MGVILMLSFSQGCARTASSDARPQSQTADAQQQTNSDWTTLLGVPKEWMRAQWTLPNGKILVEVNGGSKTDETNIYLVVDPRSKSAEPVIGIASNPRFLTISGNAIEFLCTTISFKPSFDYLWVYDLTNKTSKTESVYHSVESRTTFGADFDTPTLRSVSVANDVVDLKFDEMPGGAFVSPKTVITGDEETHVLSVEMFGVKPASTPDTILSWGEGCRLISSGSITDNAEGKQGVTVSLKLSPDLWDKIVYAMNAGELENHLVLTDTVAPTNLDKYSSSDH
ncbi:MAG: hypothetical protein ACYC6V_00475 [Bacillota bacterium]